MAEQLTFNTAELRQDPRFAQMFASQPGHELPDVAVRPYDGPEVTNYGTRSGHEILDASGGQVGTFTLVGGADKARRNVFDVRVNPELRGRRLAVAAYVGLIATLGETEKYLTSDPMHLKEPSNRVWESLVKRGVAVVDTDAGVDRNGYPRYTTKPEATQQEALTADMA